MPRNYSGLGFSLMYPDTWSVVDDSTSRAMSLESPEGAFLAVTQLDSPSDLLPAVEQAGNAMEDEYEDVEREDFSREIEGIRMTGITQRFVYLDVIITSHVLSFSSGESAYLVQIQAEDRDLDRLQIVFDAILTSLCQSLTGA